MVTIRRIEARAFARATEVLERVETAITNIFPEYVRDSLELSRTKVEGHGHIRMSIISVVLVGEKTCLLSFDHIAESLDSKERRSILRTIDLRLDDQCTFFLRIDKQDSFLEKLSLADGPDVISVQIHFQQFPRCVQEDVLKYLSDRLGDVGGTS